MALERVSKILKMADEANTSVIAFNCINYDMAYSAIAVAEQLQKPVLIMLYPEHNYAFNNADIKGFAEMVKALAAKVKIPIGLHLDHSSDFNYIMRAVKDGFTSVMFDGSMMPLEENIRLSRKIVEVARNFDVDVEAELGHVGFAKESDEENLDMYTKPDVAAEFCEATGVSSVAVAIGSAHGVYLEAPKLDLLRLNEINEATDVPLVLHGGSGIPNDQLEIAFTKGINKFNVGTEYFQLYYDSMHEYIETHKEERNVNLLFEMSKYVQGKLKDYLREKMKLSKF
ncbi:class II fructose-bisphosphate aldolase [Muricomes intestini]|jgi:ketose-bisphosphate aldolase|uniref:Fructose-bisphosphate aldolase class II n=1 Tax=Muricomes intestini TaxID=1796634 RepID=A0A4R3KF28_9FIRM|nr:class II fructose-bisphosphate aldolase [Muricomes intestini]TCS81633.1 fructose-bisphosphate aldolase class II [Muricomes intestini]HAX51072.1 fructose-bisphosphate aldolase [Lachnospiraceae bacterium]HCR83818.1 fructose-bisphosphate aldolase [Lachnospiraceae bacterium]